MPEAFEIEGGVLRKYRGSEAHVVIPKGITEIGDEAFRGCSTLVLVDIPVGVTRVSDWAFDGCKSLASVTIANGVTRVGKGAFWGCEALASVSIPEDVTEIGDSAFWNCSSLASVSIPEGVEEIGYQAFSGCTALASMNIPDGVTRIGDWAFRGCEALASVTIPDSVMQIGDWAFYGCEALASISIPESVEWVGDKAFRGCKSLASVSIAEGVKAIGDEAFYGCEALSSVDIPEGVTEIGDSAFWNCSALASVSIPESVWEIGVGAFPPSATVVCPERSYAHQYCERNHYPFVFDYQFEAFHGLLPQGFERLASPFMADEEGPFVFVSYSHKDREEVLPVIKKLYEQGWRIWYDEGLTIGDSYDETLEEHVRSCATFLLFTTPNSLKSAYIEANEVPWAVAYGRPIVECALEGQERYPMQDGSAVAVASPSDIGLALEQIEELSKGEPREAKGITVVVDPAARGVAAGGGYACCLYSEDGAAAAKAIMLEARRAGCALRDAVEEGLDPKMLSGCACLVAFLDRTFLEDEALVKPLVEVYRADGDVAVCALGDVEAADLPEGLSGLDKEHWLVYAFGIKADLNTQLARHLQRLGCRDASALPGFEYERTEGGIIITRYVGLDPSPRIEASYAGVPVVGIADGAFESRVHLKKIAIPEGVTRIGRCAFEGCWNLVSVDIPGSVTEIGWRAFSGCESLASVTIPEDVTEIGNEAFDGCKSLASVTIPNGVTRVGKGAFRDCESLASASIAEGVKAIGDSAFRDCESLASVSIAEGVKAIGDLAFSGCAALASVDIPGSVTEIGRHAFWNCSALASVSIAEGVAVIGTGAFEGCEGLVVTCPQGSFAWGYCKENSIPTVPSRLEGEPVEPAQSGFFARLFGKK